MLSLAERVSVRSYTRPLRVAIAIPDPPSPLLFRRAVGSLCTLWGGAAGLIVTGSRGRPVHERWLGVLRAHDPDILFVHSSLGGRGVLRSTETFLSRSGLSPMWVSPWSGDLSPEAGWRLVSTAAAGSPDPTIAPQGANYIRSPTPIQVALLGLSSAEGGSTRGPAPVVVKTARPIADGAVVPGSPVALAAADVPGFRMRPTVLSPFLYYANPTVEAAVWLWNVRALRGALWHGGEAELVGFFTRGRATRPVLYVDPLSSMAETALASVRVATPIRAVPVAKWEGESVRRLPVEGWDVEIDEVPVVDGVAAIAKQSPRTRGAGSAAELITADGAWAIEIEVQPVGIVERPMSLPPDARTRDLILADPGGPVTSFLRQTRSRARHRGQIAIASMPSRWPRTVSVSMHGIPTVLKALDPDSTFRLSDKGHYGRWVLVAAGGLEGLHELLTDRRGRVAFREFQRHHADRSDSTGAYRRFMTLDAIRGAFAAARRSGELPRRLPSEPPDDEWLERWISRCVSRKLLRVGIWGTCKTCLKGSFHAFGGFSSTTTCPRCGSVAAAPALPIVGYQLAEVMHQFFDNDCDVSALAAAALSRRASVGFSFDFDHEVIEQTGGKREFDFAAVIDGRLAIGESKRAGHLERRDVERLKRLARRLQPSSVFLATGSECEGGCNERCVKGYTRGPASSDTALPSGGTGAPGPRELLRELREDLAPLAVDVAVLCRGDLLGSIARPLRWDERFRVGVPATRDMAGRRAVRRRG